MIKFDDYREKYSHIRMERQSGILQITFHTEGAALKGSGPSHEQLGYAFTDIARDQENRVVIMTGTGFGAPAVSGGTVGSGYAIRAWSGVRKGVFGRPLL